MTRSSGIRSVDIDQLIVDTVGLLVNLTGDQLRELRDAHYRYDVVRGVYIAQLG